jgi:hypothetical protein
VRGNLVCRVPLPASQRRVQKDGLGADRQ